MREAIMIQQSVAAMKRFNCIAAALTSLLLFTDAFYILRTPIRSIVRRHASPTDSPAATATTKQSLLDLLQQTPRSAPTPASLTSEILSTVRALETKCPTDPTRVLDQLAGTWTLLWTTQDKSRAEANSLFAFINPLENQSYSNNPSGRANPVLPRNVQDRLEQLGLLSPDDSTTEPIKSTQTVDMNKRQVINVVGLKLGQRRRATVTVIVGFQPDPRRPRRVQVKFQSCRFALSQSPFNVNIPLGIIGPTGWLETTYIDDNLRITRGNKGSVFILTR